MKIARYSPTAKIPHGVRYANLLSLGERCVASRLRLPTKRAHSSGLFLLAGVARFELTNKGVKVLCLTAWRYPYEITLIL